jgi:hypothetical protein
VSTIRKFTEQVRWRWVLPLLMVGITSILMIVARREFFQPHGYWFHYHGAGMVTNVFPPAYLLAIVLNGPAMFPFLQIHSELLNIREIDLTCLPAVAVFWFLFGWGLDRRLAKCPPLSPKWIRATLSGSAFLLVLLFVLVLGNHLWFQGRFALNSYSRHGLWASGLDGFIYMPWLLTLLVYFGHKLWTTVFRYDSLTITVSRLTTDN